MSDWMSSAFKVMALDELPYEERYKRKSTSEQSPGVRAGKEGEGQDAWWHSGGGVCL